MKAYNGPELYRGFTDRQRDALAAKLHSGEMQARVVEDDLEDAYDAAGEIAAADLSDTETVTRYLQLSDEWRAERAMADELRDLAYEALQEIG